MAKESAAPRDLAGAGHRAGQLVVPAAIVLLAMALLELFLPRWLPGGWPAWHMVLMPVLVASGMLLRADRRPSMLLAWALALASTAVVLIAWPTSDPELVRTPAPWLAAMAGSIGVGAHVGGRAPAVAVVARALGGLLLAMAALSAASLHDPEPAPGMALGLAGTITTLGLGAWLLGRDLVDHSQRVMRVAAGMLGGLSLLVMLGWWMHLSYIVQGGTDYVPMQFNTATCALLVAVSLRLLADGRRNLALLPLLPVVALCVVSLLEEYAGWSIGAGEWLVRHQIVAEGIVPGRMAPNTAVSFLLASLGIALAPSGGEAGAARWSATWACGFVATVIAVIVLAGYLFGIPALRGWGSQTPMALMTSVSLLVVGLGLGFGGAAYRRDLRKPVAWMPLAVAAAAIAVSVMAWYAIDRDQAASRAATLARQAELTEQAIAAGILDRRSALRRMAERLSAMHDERQAAASFDLDAGIYLRDFPSLVTLMWTDRSTRVQRQLRRDGEGVIVLGRRLDFDPERMALFDRAREGGAPVESLPMTLLDSDVGELLVAPIVRDGATTGFVVAVVRYQALFPALLAATGDEHPLEIRHEGRVLYSRGSPGLQADAHVRGVAVSGGRLKLWMWAEPQAPAPLGKLLLFSGLATGGLLALALRLAGLARLRADEAESRGRELAARIDEVEQVRESEARAQSELSSVFESISDAFYTLDREWRFVFVNPRAEALLQKRRDELVGRVVWELFPATLGTVVERVFRAAAKDGRPGEFEVYFEPLASWFSARVYPHPHGLAVYFQDISDRKRAEADARRALAASERAKRLARLGNWEYDLASGRMEWSEQVFRIFGISEGLPTPSLAELVQRVHFEDRGRVQAAQGRLHRGEEELDIEYRILRPDGETRYVREIGTLLRDASGQPVSATGAIQDITERHHSEDALRELSRRLEQSLVMNRLVLENSLDVICVIDANGRFQQVSNACQPLWGYAPGELVGRAYFDLAHPEDRAHTLREGAAVLAGRPTVDFRNRVVAKDGRVVAMQWSAVWSARDRRMFAIARDVTEAEGQAMALREARDALERAQQIAGMGAWEYDLTTDKLYWSDEVFRIFKVRPGDFAGNFEAFAARVHPDDLRHLQEMQSRTIGGGPDLDEEHRILLPDGSIGHVHERARLLRDDQGRPWKLAGSVQDITERKLAKAALEQERGFLGAVLESLSEGIVACDAAGQLTLFNSTTRELHGLPEEPIPAEEWAAHYNLYQPDGTTPLTMEQVPLFRALRGETVREVEMVIAPGDLPRRCVLCSGRQIRGADGELLGAVVAMHDITARKRAQALEDGQRQVLGAIALRRPLPEVLVQIVRLAERLMPEALGSVLLLDEEGEHIRMGAAPGLPPEYNAAIHGLRIGPKAGSCGTAAWRGERVVVTDIDHDPLWEDYLPVVQPHGLKACWSTPVKAADGRVLATFANYYRQVRAPLPAELELIDGLASLCAVAIEHAAAFDAIAKGQQRFRSLFDEHPDLVYSMDLEGRYTEVNGQFLRLAGAGAEQIIGHMFDERTAPAQREMVRAHFTAATHGEARSYEMTGIGLDGARVDLRVANLPIVVDGRVTGVFGIAQDISLLRKHQRELSDALDAAEAMGQLLARLSEASLSINRDLREDTLYQQLVDRVRDMIGAHQALVSVEPAGGAQLITAFSLSDKYAAWRDYDVPIDGSGIYRLVGEHQQPMRLTQAELEAHPDWRGFGAEAGRHPPMRGWLAVPLVASDGSTLGVLQLSDKLRGEFTAEDEQVALQFAQMAAVAIERARLLEKLQVRDRFFEMSLEVFVVFNPATGRWVQVNQMLSDITGFSREELCSRPVFEFMHPDDEARTRDRARRLALGEVIDPMFMNRYRCREGGYRWMEWMSAPDEKGLVYAVGRDVTERLQAEATLRQTLADLNARNRELQDFAFIASHDLQEPLRKIRAFSDRLQQRHAAALAAEARDYLDRTTQAAERMQVLIDNLLAYSRVAARSKPFTRVKLDQVLAGVLDDLEAALESSGGQVESGPLPEIDGDPTQMRQVFQNLLSNALKFRAPDRPPRVRISASPEDRVDGRYWILRFEDNGIGFEPRYAEKVFGPFQRLHARQHYEGTGIGLAIVRRIVERHRGSVSAEGRPGQGATFTIEIPEHQPAGE
ncbi:PAS domain S-box protein [Arenimonas caeni]|jgi:PAS domain S-box-containing protein|uniref:PAS domain S-box protein n=1 Tax=Arenimonas caeni TaxID=2058085 RepID=UPI002A361DC1|nr:PAS domain S-box protein [Arenimonas caeni]MDY0021454.1 PAS domain S-box protein [Arenimonas caeni]